MPTIGESKTFWFSEGDFQPDLLQTSERQEILQAFLAKLKAEGWQPAGHGKSWYSYRFSPVSPSSGPDPRNRLTPEQQESARKAQETISEMAKEAQKSCKGALDECFRNAIDSSQSRWE